MGCKESVGSGDAAFLKKGPDGKKVMEAQNRARLGLDRYISLPTSAAETAHSLGKRPRFVGTKPTPMSIASFSLAK